MKIHFILLTLIGVVASACSAGFRPSTSSRGPAGSTAAMPVAMASPVVLPSAPSSQRPVVGFASNVMVRIAEPAREVPATPSIGTLRIQQGAVGPMIIPYIQTSKQLTFKIALTPFANLEIALDRVDPLSGLTVRIETLANVSGESLRTINFSLPVKGTYQLTVTARGDDGSSASDFITDLAYGDIFAALGDSITSGIGGNHFNDVDQKHPIGTWLSSPVQMTSLDSRNFPQFARRQSPDLPANQYNESFLSDLNNLLTAKFAYPVFILNEGASGTTSGEYLNEVVSDPAFINRLRQLKPNRFLVNLGVNDMLRGNAEIVKDRPKVTAGEVTANLQAIARDLVSRNGANPAEIHFGLPSYVNIPQVASQGNSYLDPVFQLRNIFAGGPHFWLTFSENLSLLSADQVHPNSQGYRRMAEMWAEVLAPI